MKLKQLSLFAIAFLFVFSMPAAPTCEDYINQGRAYLAATNLAAANSSFSNAVLCSPTHQTGNVFYAATRLLVLPNRPIGSNFLNRLGFTNTGRSIYHWTSRPPTDGNGIPIAPVGVNANEAAALLRTNILSEILAAERNLTNVTDTNFALALTSAETRTIAVTIDYGDVRLLRAGLKFAEYFAYTTYSWNLDAQLAVLRSLYTNAEFSFQGLFARYPSLLTFATTNDLNAAKAAFTNGVACYLEASQFIRSRPTNIIRLFNLDGSQAEHEENFRLTLIDLRNSLDGPIQLAVDPTLTVHFASQFTGTHPLRSFLPEFHRSRFVLGTWPDLTFGGLIGGVEEGGFEEGMAKLATPVPKIAAPLTAAGQQFQFLVNTLRGRGYVVQISSDLRQWVDHNAFFAFGPTSMFSDNIVPSSGPRFYRLVDQTANMPRPFNDDFDHRIPITGLGIVVTGYNSGATVEPDEPGQSMSSVWWSWTAPISGNVIVATVGSVNQPSVTVYTGKSLGTLTQVASGDYPFPVIAGATYQIQVSSYDDPGAIQLVITIPPTLTVSSPSNGFISTVPTNITISASAIAGLGSITNMQVYFDYGGFIAQTSGPAISVTLTNVGPGAHSINVSASDHLGVTSYSNLFVTIRPPNDLFTNRIVVSGSTVMVTGTNDGASKEPNEPRHAGFSGGSSVWWTWTSPFNGAVTISAEMTSRFGGPILSVLGVYTGNSVSTLAGTASAVSGDIGPAQTNFTAVSGRVYQIAVDGRDGQGGNIVLNIFPGAAPNVTLTAPTRGTSFDDPANVTIIANASDPDGTIARVEFYENYYYPYRLIATATNVSHSFVWSNLTAGYYSLFAKAIDNSGLSAYSLSVYFFVLTPPPPPPANDNFADAIAIPGAATTVHGVNFSASSEVDEPATAGNSPATSIWWSWTAPKTGDVTISTLGSDFDTVLGIYTGPDFFSFNLIAADDDSDGSLTSKVVFNAMAGTTYQIVVDGYGGAEGNVTLNVSQP